MAFSDPTPRPTVELWTDGSGSVTGEPGGWAYVLRTRTAEGWATREGAGCEQATTSNRMEITAVLEGLRALKRPCRVTVYSDSQYVVNTFAKGWIKRWQAKNWRKVKNDDLWRQVLRATAMHRVEFKWIRGHNGTELNERCDQLAGAQRDIAMARRAPEVGRSLDDLMLVEDSEEVYF